MTQSLSPILATLSAALIIAGPRSETQTSGAAPKADSAPAGNAQSGRRLYTNYGCYQCHGREGQGSSITGPRIGPSPISFPALIRYVRQPTGQMPPYTSKVVSDSELADMYAFLQSLPQPHSSAGPGYKEGEPSQPGPAVKLRPDTVFYTFTASWRAGQLGAQYPPRTALNGFDFSHFKNLAFGAETFKLQLRAEAFSLFNHANFGVRTMAVLKTRWNWNQVCVATAHADVVTADPARAQVHVLMRREAHE